MPLTCSLAASGNRPHCQAHVCLGFDSLGTARLQTGVESHRAGDSGSMMTRQPSSPHRIARGSEPCRGGYPWLDLPGKFPSFYCCKKNWVLLIPNLSMKLTCNNPSNDLSGPFLPAMTTHGPNTPPFTNASPTLKSVTPSSTSGTPYPENGTPPSKSGTPPSAKGTPFVANGTPPFTKGTPFVANGVPFFSNGVPFFSNGVPEIA